MEGKKEPLAAVGAVLQDRKDNAWFSSAMSLSWRRKKRPQMLWQEQKPGPVSLKGRIGTSVKNNKDSTQRRKL